MGTRAWALLLVLCGTIFLEGIDVAMLAVAIPSIRSDLDLPTDTAAWVMSAYVLGYAGFTLLGGRAADLLGRRRMFLTWLTVFLAFSGLGGFATEGWTLIVARFVTGVSAAFMTPAALSLITTSYEEGEQRNKALLVFAGTAAGGFSLGLVIGGLLTQLGWRWVFFAPVLLAGALLVAATRLIPHQPHQPRPAESENAESENAEPGSSEPGSAEAEKSPGRPRRRTEGFDILGAATAAAAMLLAAYAVIRLEHGLDGWRLTAGAALAATTLLVVFVAVERRTPTPLVRLGILRTGSVVRADLGALLFVGAFFGFQFVLTLYLQETLRLSAFETGLVFGVVGVMSAVAGTYAPKVIGRLGARRTLVASLAGQGAFIASLLALGTGGWSVWLATVAVSLACMCHLGAIISYGLTVTSGVPDHEQGLATGLVTSTQQVGLTLGIPLLGILATTAPNLLSGVHTVVALDAAIVLGAAVLVAIGLGRRPSGAVEPEPLGLR
ncbi:MFS transporter [Streptomyces phaeochromogenes]|uniref:MFS transporter n=1 Tax=Streptomyces phaeochromogenes TaxID=1923 RepID=UPI0006E1F8A1|nr:MFS transporter [Streptomyces phaeochromogenes]